MNLWELAGLQSPYLAVCRHHQLVAMAATRREVEWMIGCVHHQSKRGKGVTIEEQLA